MDPETVVPFPSNAARIVTRAKKAQENYTAAAAAEGEAMKVAIAAVIEYGEALLEGREANPSNKEFSRWVEDNELDLVKPWTERQERTAAMNIAEIVRGSGTSDTFAECSSLWPTNMMHWYRRQSPEALAKSAERAKAKQAALEATREAKQKAEAAAAIADFEASEDARDEGVLTAFDATASEKSKAKLEDAIRIYKKKLDKKFWEVVNTEVDRRIKAADDHVRVDAARLSKENTFLRIELNKRGLFTKAEYRMLQMCCHPDNSASPEVRNRISAKLVEFEPRLLKE